LLYVSGNRIIVARDARRILTATEMNYIKQRDTLGQIIKTNKEVSKELDIISVVDKIQAYRKKVCNI